ncbi:M20/M25/M40 family metallo-hydrolase [Sphingomonas sp.]|uniref:M20/M25/M40 family metallo-hydrolase n=1 Tax=Sphingomonas sp. TaxID=28214 RepID=UPI002C465403|nr:M20/M25/M40 family metallo-hydrolase [Sphingomonas sp.]HTG39400.1 M20/M25/M40 family metallo-hydrolase [Sphingomonas sp.]
MHKTLAAGLLIALMAGTALAQSTPDFSADRVKADITWLADDARQGRDAGTPGYDAAAEYVAKRFAALGLTPANGSDWYQQVPFVKVTTDKTARRGLTIGGKSFAHGGDVMANMYGTGAQSLETELVFVGRGVVDEARGIDDYKGLDVTGKTVVLFYGVPKGIPSDVAAAINNRKQQIAEEHGAVGVITLLDSAMAKQFPWEVIKEQGDEPYMSWATDTGAPYRNAPGIKASGLARGPAAQALFAGAPQDYKAVLAAVDKGVSVGGFALKPRIGFAATSAAARFTSPNVVAMIPGSDPALKDEAVLLMAHLDHVGMGDHAKGDDKIFNGAMDNAAGVATMMEAARAFMQAGEKPKRTILFAAVTAEEDGLLGSQYLAKHPLPGAKVTSVVNLDMPVLLYDFTDVVAFGAEHSTMGPIVAKATGDMGIKLSPDPMPEENLFTRSDHYRFVTEGVPSVFLVTGFANGGEKVFKDFLANHYHKPSDEVSLPFNWVAGAKFARVNYNIARALADAPAAPVWYEDSEFGKLYAADAPKAKRPDAAK